MISCLPSSYSVGFRSPTNPVVWNRFSSSQKVLCQLKWNYKLKMVSENSTLKFSTSSLIRSKRRKNHELFSYCNFNNIFEILLKHIEDVPCISTEEKIFRILFLKCFDFRMLEKSYNQLRNGSFFKRGDKSNSSQ